MEEQVQILNTLGCYYIQGFHYSKPVSADHIDDILVLYG